MGILGQVASSLYRRILGQPGMCGPSSFLLSTLYRALVGETWVTKARSLPDRKGRPEQSISSRDRAKGLSDLQMVQNLVVLGILSLPALGICPAILEPQEGMFSRKTTGCGAARLHSRTAVAWTEVGSSGNWGTHGIITCYP